MDSYAWLLLSFVIFILIAQKHILKAIYTIINNARDSIFSQLSEAEKILDEANQQNDESRKLLESLDEQKKSIISQSRNQINFELEAKREEFKILLESKKERLQDTFNREELEVKERIFNELVNLLEEKLISITKNNKIISDDFLNKMSKL